MRFCGTPPSWVQHYFIVLPFELFHHTRNAIQEFHHLVWPLHAVHGSRCPRDSSFPSCRSIRNEPVLTFILLPFTHFISIPSFKTSNPIHCFPSPPPFSPVCGADQTQPLRPNCLDGTPLRNIRGVQILRLEAWRVPGLPTVSVR